MYRCTHINNKVITTYDPNPNPNHKKVLNIAPETLTLILNITKAAAALELVLGFLV